MQLNYFRNKSVSWILIGVFVSTFGASYPASAQTGGPQSVQFSGGSNGNGLDVNQFTGDLSYSVPVMVVPGPNGGYPISLSYNSGRAVHEEASWVGLGWNLNFGAVNRTMRGIPDEFNGSDEVIKSRNIKSNATISLKSTAPMGNEIFGLPLSIGGAVTLYYNTYAGPGTKHALILKLQQKDSKTPSSSSQQGLAANLALGYDSNKGTSFTPSLSFGSQFEKTGLNFQIGASFDSYQGMTGLSFNTSFETGNGERYRQSGGFGSGTSLSYNFIPSIPSVNLPMQGKDIYLSTNLGGYSNTGFYNNYGDVGANFSIQRINQNKKEEVHYPAFGYNNSHLYPESVGLDATPSVIMDFYYERDVPATPEAPLLPLPVYTSDVYDVSGPVSGRFKPCRGDVGVLKENFMLSEFEHASASFGLGIPNGTALKIDGNAGYGMSQSSAGPIRDLSPNEVSEKYKFLGPEDGGMEHLYFKMADDLSGTEYSWKAEIGDENAASFLTATEPVEDWDVNGYPDPNIIRPTIKNVSSIGNFPNKRKERESRSKLIKFWSKAECEAEFGSALLSEVTAYGFDNDMPVDVYGQSDFKGHHIAQFSLIDEGGNEVVYGLPVYNLSHRTSNFSLGPVEDDGLGNFPMQTAFAAHDDNLSNKKGARWYYNATTIDPYITSHLITKILSPDYVDVDQNGPSQTDLGDYTKFTYSQVNEYTWRSPYEECHLNPGYYSSESDNMGSYTEGVRQQYFVKTIETKTHIAVFELFDRNDGIEAKVGGGLPANNDLDSSNKGLKSVTLYKLDEIGGYDPQNPIVKVDLRFDYSLCAGISNYAEMNSTPLASLPEFGGKLTLREVATTYYDSNKGEEEPYVFEYYSNEDLGLGAFNYRDVGRWGEMYALDNNWTTLQENPYIEQKRSEAQYEKHADFASVWNIKNIKPPGGAKIHVEYEMDEYAFVQDQDATQMVTILGFSTVDGTFNTKNWSINNPESSRVYFSIPDEIGQNILNDPELLSEYESKLFGTQTWVSFKAWMQLKKEFGSNGDYIYDYVDGYAKIQGGTAKISVEGDQVYGSVDLQAAVHGELDKKRNPLRFAGWQYLKNERMDLLYKEVNGSLDDEIISFNPDFLANGVQAIFSSLNLIVSYYNACAARGFCKEIGSYDPNGSENEFQKPSFLRIGVIDGMKWGGGSRVKTILRADGWQETNNTLDIDGDGSIDGEVYETSYTYLLENGMSSGVASNEPSFGYEECALSKPIMYNVALDKWNWRSEETFIDGPVGKSFLPGANVGYSRIIQDEKRLFSEDGNEVQEYAVSPRVVSEFYTAKDFPVVVEKPLKPIHTAHTPFPIAIPGVVALDMYDNAYSQGFVITLNDMHGKVKSSKTFPKGAKLWIDPNSTEDEIADIPSPSISVDYEYFTEEGADKRLENRVPVVVDNLKNVDNMEIGISTEMWLAEREYLTWAMDVEANANLDWFYIYCGIVVTASVPVSFSENLYRSISSTKVIRRNGILKEVRTKRNGSVQSVENLVFDNKTGNTVLSAVNNDFDEQRYVFNYPAHWMYEGMGAAHETYRMSLSELSIDGNGLLSSADFVIGDYVSAGDKLSIKVGSTNEVAWVSEMTPNGALLIGDDGEEVTIASEGGVSIKVLDPGSTNQIGLSAGSIVTLTNPFSSSGNFSLALQGALDNAVDLPQGTPVNFSPCGVNGEEMTITLGGGELVISDSDGNEVDFSSTYFTCHNGEQSLGDCWDLNIQFVDGTLVITGIDECVGETTTVDCAFYEVLYPEEEDEDTWDEWPLTECPMAVLQASATSFSDGDSGWEYEYSDLSIDEDVASDLENAANLYKWKKQGLWRPTKSFVYQTDRLQGASNPGTDISEDGLFEIFHEFDWVSSNVENANPHWTRAALTNQFHPNGEVLEIEDALGNKISKMMGYDDHLVIAEVINSPYLDMAYEDFEQNELDAYSNMNHWNLQTAATVSQERAHTGTNSLKLSSNSDALQVLLPIPEGQQGALNELNFHEPHWLSLWTHGNYDNDLKIEIRRYLLGGDLEIDIYESNEFDHPFIEGWKKIELEVNGYSCTKVEIRFINQSGGNVFIDDLRLHPKKSLMTTKVYDKENFRLISSNDQNNYATFYSYDEKGKLIQAKKETNRGIFTISNNRSNIRHD